ncbi:MAG: sigma-70 family RNA polymerase sigma factor [Tepidisphaeraceae bacterium]|jgi:RNA polymerase sigma-70 factor (subfamily 1)
MSSTEDELTLITEAVAGDSAALEMLLFRCRNRLLAYVQAHFPAELVGFLEPQDVLQDTWLKAIRAISDFHPDGPDPVYRWLVTIARNLILDQVKYARTAKRKNTRVPLERTDENASIIRLLEEMAVYHRTPSKSAASHELIAALDSAIERLPSDQARALRLRHLEGLEIREIAHRMKRTEGSVSMLCNRALKSLRWEMRSVSLYM